MTKEGLLVAETIIKNTIGENQQTPIYGYLTKEGLMVAETIIKNTIGENQQTPTDSNLTKVFRHFLKKVAQKLL